MRISSDYSHTSGKKAAAEKFLVRHFLAIQQAVAREELGLVYWLPGLENPADGLTKTKSDAAPLLRLLESGACNPGTLRPLRGVGSRGNLSVFSFLGFA